jgi:hypothetical protein
LVRGMTTWGRGIELRLGRSNFSLAALTGHNACPVVLFYRQDHALEHVYVPAVAYSESNCIIIFTDDCAAQRNSQIPGRYLYHHRCAYPVCIHAWHLDSPEKDCVQAEDSLLPCSARAYGTWALFCWNGSTVISSGTTSRHQFTIFSPGAQASCACAHSFSILQSGSLMTLQKYFGTPKLPLALHCPLRTHSSEWSR